MAVVFGIGFELNCSLASYTGAGWAYVGSLDVSDSSRAHQHPSGYGGGERSLRCIGTSSLETPTDAFSAPAGTLGSSFYSGSDFQSGNTLIEIHDASGASILSISAAETGPTSQLSLLHAGVTVATTSAGVSRETWHRVGVRWSTNAGVITGRLYVDGNLRAESSVALSTGLTAGGLLWGNICFGSTYHDHSVVWDDHSADSTRGVWIQGLVPNSDDVNGAFTPTPPTSDNYERVQDAGDAGYLSTTSASYCQFQQQNRADINALWADPRVIAISVWADAKGDGTLQDGAVKMVLGASSLAGTTVSMPASGSLSNKLSATKPGTASPWDSTDIDNIRIGYTAG